MSIYRIPAEPIESTIIAYFDGRLSDDESAELMHRVSVSPEIRQLFQEHEALRRLANRAQRNTVVPASLEESLFSRIAGDAERDRIPVGFWSVRRISTMAGAIAILLAFIAGSMEFERSGKTAANNSSLVTPALDISSGAAGTTITASERSQNGSAVTSPIRNSHQNIARSFDNIERENSALVENKANVPGGSMQSEDATIALEPAVLSEGTPHINMPGATNAPIYSAEDLLQKDDRSLFEVGLATNSAEFELPANVPASSTLLSNFSLRAGVNLDPNDQVGAMVARQTGSFALVSISSGMGFSSVGFQHQSPQLMEELYYKRRQPFIVNNAVLYWYGTLGGGLYSNGNFYGVETGLEIPFGDHMLAGVGVVVNKTHQNQQSFSGPVIFDNGSTYDPYSGSIRYSLSYRF